MLPPSPFPERAAVPPAPFEIAPGEHAFAVRVRYADSDQMGVAYYANYLIWFEVGRTEWLRSRGYTYRSLEGEGVFLPVTEACCRRPHGTLFSLPGGASGARPELHRPRAPGGWKLRVSVPCCTTPNCTLHDRSRLALPNFSPM